MKLAHQAIGIKIRHLREAMKLTQEQLADRVEISLKHMGHIERGIANPTLKTLIALADALDSPLPVLIDYGDWVLTDRDLRDSITRSLDLMDSDQLRSVKLFCDVLFK